MFTSQFSTGPLKIQLVIPNELFSDFTKSAVTDDSNLVIVIAPVLKIEVEILSDEMLKYINSHH